MTEVSPSRMLESSRHGDVEGSYRPSLVKLLRDLRELRKNLRSGFESRRAVLDWLRRLTVRELGEVDQHFYHEIGRAFRSPYGDTERTVLSILLTGSERQREVSSEHVDAIRGGIEARVITPALEQAYRSLRQDATEYVDDTEDSEHDPSIQRFPAMRPYIAEIEGWQRDCLGRFLDGFDNRNELLDWYEVFLKATHGERVRVLEDGELVEIEEVGRKLWDETATARVLVSDTDRARYGREIYAATLVIPTFNAGVRDIASKAGELPDAETQEREVPLA
ncbi:MAG: hypothetical protein ABEI77_07595 [Halorientalis sp.]